MKDGTTCPCQWCGKPTHALVTQECDDCWWLRKRMDAAEPKVLEAILLHLGMELKEPESPR